MQERNSGETELKKSIIEWRWCALDRVDQSNWFQIQSKKLNGGIIEYQTNKYLHNLMNERYYRFSINYVWNTFKKKKKKIKLQVE